MNRATEVVIDDNEGRYTMIVTDEDGTRQTIDIHDCVLEFYERVRTEIGPYYAEYDSARYSMPQPVTVAVEDVYAAIDAGYALDDPKSPGYHDRMVD